MNTLINTNKTTNPFTINHCKEQCERFGEQEGRKSGNAELKWVTPQGRLNDYLNVNIRFLDFKIPVLTIDGQTWMSLTPMEIQSAHCAIQLATGNVATAGLGLGYYAMEAARKPEVVSVFAFEENEDVINIFNERTAHTDERKKITIVQGDVRERMKDYEFDLVFMDPYQAMLPDELITDARLFRKNNKIKIYWPWGMELITHLMIEMEYINDDVGLFDEEKELFDHWESTPASDDDQLRHTMLSDLRCPVSPEDHEDYLEEAWEAIGR